MVRKTFALVGVLLGAVLLGWGVLLAGPAHADVRGEDPDVVELEGECDDAQLDDVEFPATCIDGKWVTTDDGFGTFGDDFDDDQSTFTAIFVLGALAVVGLGIGGFVWRASAARSMARRAGMNEDDAVNVALLGQHGIEAAYLASTFRPGQAPAGDPSEDAASRLAELQRLRDQGLITYDEYEAQRAKVIEDI